MSNVFSAVVRLARDAEVRQTNGGTVMNFTAANDVGYGDRKATNWLACSVWGKRAESQIVNYMKKGQQVFVSGELSLDEYKANDGTMKPQLRLNVTVLDLVGAKNDNPQPAPVQTYAPPPQPAYVPPHEAHRQSVAAHNASASDDSDIPF